MDEDGGLQFFQETLDMAITPEGLHLGPAETAHPSELFGLGASIVSGPIWRTEGSFRTEDYAGEALSTGGSVDIVAINSYESFTNPNIKGADVGYSLGSLSGWSLSTNSNPLFGMPRVGFWGR